MKSNIEVAISLKCTDKDYKDFEHKYYNPYTTYSGEGEGRHQYRTLPSGSTVNFPIDGIASYGIIILAAYGSSGFEFEWDTTLSGASLASDAIFLIVESGTGLNELNFSSLDPSGTKLNVLYGGNSE